MKNVLKAEDSSKKSKKIIALRTAAGILGAAILILCISVTMSFTGNPVSSFIAEKKSAEYVKSRYSDNGRLEIKDVSYNFKIGQYMVRFQDRDSEDIWFNVFYREGEGVVGDDYEYMVDKRETTLLRLQDELAEKAVPIVKKIADKRNFDMSRCYVALDEYFYGGKNGEKAEIPPLNTPYSKELGLEGSYLIDFSSKENLDVQDMADVINEIYSELKAEGFSVMSIYTAFYMPEGEVSVTVTPEQIGSGLAESIENSLNGGEADGIDVYADTSERA